MKLGYTIIYVESVEKVLQFYKKAFGFEIKFIHDSGDYGELNTGETVLAFASHELGEANIGKFIKVGEKEKPLGFELAFVTNNVSTAYEKAIACGAAVIKTPEEKPWGQTAAYVRAMEGTVIEICSPINE